MAHCRRKVQAKKDKKGKKGQKHLHVFLPLLALLVLFCFSKGSPSRTPREG
jgi:hypothetical protein